jgi:hypothetical protein
MAVHTAREIRGAVGGMAQRNMSALSCALKRLKSGAVIALSIGRERNHRASARLRLGNDSALICRSTETESSPGRYPDR